MCGIVGYCGLRPAAPILLEGLRRLEYRGYDSSGISVGNDGKLTVIKKMGKIKNLKSHVPEDLPGTFGIGHTRWATHGEVNDENAHPHSDASGKLTIVHNGIIENYIPLKEKLMAEGVEFKSETDSEVIVHLMASLYDGDLEKAVKETVTHLEGTYGLVCVHADEPGRLVGARNGSPLVIGVGDGEMFLASDVTAMIAYTKQVVYCEDGEVVSLTAREFRTTDLKDREIEKKVDKVAWDLSEVEKAGYSTYMEKEISEQAESIHRAMRGRISTENASGILGGLNLSNQELRRVKRVRILSAGTSYYAAMTAAYMLESMARIPATAEFASEVRYANPVVEPETLFFVISQSGETADTLFAMRELKRKGATVLGVCNAVGSTIARESDGGVYIHAGPEIAVASTKAFTSTLTVFYLFSLYMARMRDMAFHNGKAMVEALELIPGKVNEILARKDELQAMAKKYLYAKNFLFLGRGINYPLALEGALKLKEISYVHAEGTSSAEMKHGPIALISEEFPTMMIIPNDSLREKNISNLKELKARKGPVLVIATEGDTEIADIADDVFYIPKTMDILTPLLTAIPLQVFAYYMALGLNRNVDQPRNLAKSVTVE
ncbi:MAG: glutamine--fructose-6-phosphate transaminase (isomerizing) [Spirochaetales bacterium]|nr:glutamine--fructose-6-phosphate transaminase (isomerizing) [Spirochaetales bacterium]